MKKTPLLIKLSCLLAFALPSLVSASLATLPTLKYGDIRPEVRTLQEALNSIGQNITKSGEETTRFGEKTLFSIKNLQCKHNIVCTGDASHGVFGPQTKGLLISLQQRTLNPRVLGATTEGLIAHYNFDGNANDATGNGNNGTAINGPTYVAGKIGQALNANVGYNGSASTGSFIELPAGSAQAGSGNITVAAWTYYQGTGSGVVIATQGSGGAGQIGYSLAYSNATQAYFRVDNNLISKAASSQTISPGWHHIVGTFVQGSTVSLYIDGVLAQTQTSGVPSGNIRGLTPPRIGDIAQFNAGDARVWIPFKGLIDDVRVYNRALSLSEIQDLYAAAGDGGTVTITTPINGQCSTTINACSTGSFSDVPDSASNYLWSCNGSNGGTNASCSLPITPAASTFTLTANKTGTGQGTLTSSPSGINCGSDCNETLNQGTSVTLSATPAADSVFSGWSGGGCSGTGNCTIVLNANTTVTANFSLSTPVTGAPIISNVYHKRNQSQTAVTISWQTNEASDSQIEFGPTIGYGSVSPLNNSLTVAHTETISVSPDSFSPKTYHYRVKSKDSTGAIGVSPDYTFTLLPTPNNSGPQLCKGSNCVRLQKNMTWAFLGDSITSINMYNTYMEMYFHLRYPELDLHFREESRSGSTPGELLPQFMTNSGAMFTNPELPRFLSDVYPLNPQADIMSIMWAGNGGLLASTYRSMMTDLIDNYVVGKSGAQPIILGGIPANTSDGSNVQKRENDLSVDIAQVKGLPYTDLWNTLRPIWYSNFLLAPSNPNRIDLQQGGDDIHFGPSGHISIAHQILKQLGAEAEVSSATIDAGAQSLVSQSRTSVTNISRSGDTLTFRRLDTRSPFIIPNGADVILKLQPSILNDLSKYMLKVTNLTSGTYEVRVNGVVSGRIGSNILATGEGWNMSYMKNGPIYDKAMNVLSKIQLERGQRDDPATANHYLSAYQDSVGCGTAAGWLGEANYRSNAGDSYTRLGLRGEDLRNRLTSLTHNVPCTKRDLTLADQDTWNAAEPEAWNFQLTKVGDDANYVDTAVFTPTLAAPIISTQPQARSAAIGATAVFSVTASGNPSPTYQWQKNGVNISGATSATYTTPTLTLADNNSMYRVIITNSQGSLTSNAATLTVTATAPVSTKFSDGNRVQVNTTSLNVRSAAGTANTLLGTHNAGDLGTVLGDAPVSANGFIWWRIDFDSGVDGWVAENYLDIASAVTDVTAPVLSAGAPLGILARGTTQVTLSVATNESATCKYSTSANTAYASMANTFSMTGARNHSVTLTGLTNGNAYTNYVRCSDMAGNANASDYPISFSVSNLAGSLRAWSYPGVPYTDWAYDPFTHPAPTRPTEWPLSEKRGYYFIEPNNPSATDVVNGSDTVDANGKRYGYPSRPRKTLPLTSWNNTNISAGSIFWIKGGEWNSHFASFHDWFANFDGTAENPIWIYGDPTDKPVFKDLRIGFDGGDNHHVFVENIIWDKWDSVANGSVSINSGAHHITVRNVEVKNRDYLRHGSFFSAEGGTTAGSTDVHDIVFYNITFKNNGGGVNWNTVDADMHGYKFDGNWDKGRAYRIWVIDNKTMPGDTPDPIDGFYKALAGNLVQVGDQNVGRGNVDHVWIAGNYGGLGLRQGCVGFKRSGHAVVSSNVCRDLTHSGSSQGAAYSLKYDRQENIWFVNNYVENVDSFIIRSETTSSGAGGPDTFRPIDTRVYIIGNVLKDSMREPWFAPDMGGIGGWKTKGISIQDMNGKVYIANNVIDTSVYGVYFSPHPTRQSVGSEMHVYNNIAVNLSAGRDTSTAANNGIMITTDTNTEWFIENNLVDSGRFYYSGTQYNSADAFNARANASGNKQGNPLFTNPAAGDYSLRPGSPAIDAGIQNYTTNGSPDVYQLFINAFADDPDFPGDPADVWPKDFNKNARFSGSSIDIGAFEYGATGGGTYIPPVILPPVVLPPTTPTDSDSDGVADTVDRCPNTPAPLRSIVNASGCPRPMMTLFDIRPDITAYDLTAVSAFELGRTGFGKIRWNQPVSLARNTERMDIDTNLSIIRNKVILNSTALPELNRAAQITLFNIDQANPRILKDGIECTTCSVNSFDNVTKTIVFTVTGFSTYEVVEGVTTPVIVPDTYVPPAIPQVIVSSGGGGGSSGGGGIAVPGTGTVTLCAPGQVFNTTTGQRCTTTSVSIDTANGSPQYNFTRNLTIGAKGEDVKQLQIFLNANGFAIASVGAGSPGSETTTFGPATRSALARYQASKGITPAAGYFGPATRARVNGGGGSVIPSGVNSSTPSTVSTPGLTLKLGAFGPAVKALRTKLRALGYFAPYGSAPDVPASASVETSNFGATTESAVKKFQCDKSIICTGSAATTGWGATGPRTRGALGI
jgi:uncharacterized protein YgiM (DUF1202 family)